MQVSEIREIAPKAGAYELNPEAKYLLLVDRESMPETLLRELPQALQKNGINHVVIMLTSNMNSIKFYEFEEK